MALSEDGIERGFHLFVEAMVAADCCGSVIETFVFRRRTARDEHSRAVLSKRAPYAPANASGGAGHNGDLAFEIHGHNCI